MDLQSYGKIVKIISNIKVFHNVFNECFKHLQYFDYYYQLQNHEAKNSHNQNLTLLK
jgi:hypothetical protein